MARVQHNCTGCVPIDASIIEVYTQLISTESRAEEAAERAEHAAEHAIGKSPYIGENGDWWEWNDEQAAFIDTGVQAQGQVAVDIEMSTTSTNPVQNRVVTAAVNEKYTKPATGIPATDIAEGVIPDVSQFITASVNNLVNYYLKSETYNKTEVDSLIAAVSQFSYEVVATLPTASASTMYKIYLVPSARPETQNVKDEYITIRSGSEGSYTYAWEQIGSTAIDLSGYVTTAQLNTALSAYTTTANLTTLLAAKQDVIADLSTIRSGAASGATAYQKPSGGIPKSDLASGVQGSLDLADSAIQARPQGEITPVITPADYATREELGELEAKLRENETISLTLQRSGYYVNTSGTRAYYAPFAIFTPIPVKAGDRIVATIDGYNSAASPISWGATDNTDSDMSVTPLAEYTSTNHYEVTIENDGYLIVCGDKTTTPIVTIYGEMYDFEQIEVNKENIEEVRGSVTGIGTELSKVETRVQDFDEKLGIAEDVAVSIGLRDYYVDANGGRAYYAIMGIYGPIPVQKGDKVSAKNMLLENSAIAALAWSESPDMSSSMSCTVLAIGDSTGDATTEYSAVIPGNGYLFISADKNTTPTLTISRVPSYSSLFEDVAEIEGALEDSTQVLVSMLWNSYYVNPSGTRAYYGQFAIFSPVSVKKGDRVIVENVYINVAVCPIAFNTTGDTSSTMVSTPMAVFEEGKTVYTAVAPQDGYFIISNDKTKTPSVKIFKLLNIPEMKQIGSLLSGKITMLFGDSLTAGSTPGVVAFGRVIANVLGVPYRAFVFDRFDPSPDTNAADVDIDIPNISNYAKDGTKNQITSSRSDSVLQRVKNHITADTNVDYVLIECCINDYTSGTKGAISASYTGPFNENTAIGAIEETCRYLSSLGKDIRFGFYIPWQISYVPESYFNDYIPVFEKWAVPLFDMRKCAGFNMRWCIRHQELYSLPASSYANYDNTATYNLDDKVKYEGFLYKCNADGVTGIPPTNETYWTKVSEGSFDGCHLNSLGHYVVAGKIQSFMERL